MNHICVDCGWEGDQNQLIDREDGEIIVVACPECESRNVETTTEISDPEMEY